MRTHARQTATHTPGFTTNNRGARGRVGRERVRKLSKAQSISAQWLDHGHVLYAVCCMPCTMQSHFNVSFRSNFANKGPRHVHAGTLARCAVRETESAAAWCAGSRCADCCLRTPRLWPHALSGRTQPQCARPLLSSKLYRFRNMPHRPCDEAHMLKLVATAVATPIAHMSDVVQGATLTPR